MKPAPPRRLVLGEVQLPHRVQLFLEAATIEFLSKHSAEPLCMAWKSLFQYPSNVHILAKGQG